MYALKKLIKNSHVKYLNGEFETLENAYSRWQSIQIKLQLTFTNANIYDMCLTQV